MTSPMGISDDVIGDVIKLLSILNPHILYTLVYRSSTGSTKASSPVGTSRTTNRQIDVTAERHVRWNITLKLGNVSKNWMRRAARISTNGVWPVRVCTSTLLTKSNQRIPSLVSDADISCGKPLRFHVPRRVQFFAAYNSTNRTRAS